MNRKLIKPLKITTILIVVVLLMMLVLPMFFTGTITEKVKTIANKNLNGELNFKSAGLSFFQHFPSLTLTLYNFSLKGSKPFEHDTLLSANKIAFGLNLKSLLTDKIIINHIFFSNALINIQVTEHGEPNYNVYVSTGDKEKPAERASESQVKIEAITISNSHLIYNDRSLPMYVNAEGFNYTGKGDLSKEIFDLQTHAEIQKLDFYFDNIPYVLSKSIKADLITKINTNSLALIFERNNLKINKLPIEFKGKFEFLKNGFGLDFNITSKEAELGELLTILPPDYLKWVDNSKITGAASLDVSLKGNFQPETGQMPEFNMRLMVQNGNIAYQKAPAAISKLNCKFSTRIPMLNPDSLEVNIDTLYFNIDKDDYRASLHTKGLSKLYLKADIEAKADLEKWYKAYGIEAFDTKGILDFDFFADGQLQYGPDPGKLRKDTVLLSIPRFELKTALKNGYFKYTDLPEPLKNIGFALNAACSDGNPENINIDFNSLNINFLQNYFKGYLKLNGTKNAKIESDLKAELNLADIKKVINIDSTELSGIFKFGLTASGNYFPAKKLLPLIKANIDLQNAFIKTAYYPNPVSNISMAVSTTNTTGQLKDMEVNINPFKFEFEGKPFEVTATLNNFSNLQYAVKALGTIDLGRIYKVFSIRGTDVNGSIDANITLKGSQSDAMNGNYNKLHNSGKLVFKNISLSAEAYPLPFLIHQGTFRFENNKIWFSNFLATYGQSDFRLEGNLSNIVNFALTDKQVLQGNFKFTSDKIYADSFTVFADTGTTATTTSTTPSGVVIIPENLDISFEANVQKIFYNDLVVNNFTGKTRISKGILILDHTRFSLVDCDVKMDATYGSINPEQAYFQYHINAVDFDIKKAYDQIKLFRDLATSAGKVNGTVSLDYEIKGKLNNDMLPVYPSLEGGGVLSVKKIKVAGLRLLNEVSKNTERPDINNPDISKVDIKTTIKNNLITIEQFKMKIAGFRLKISGTSTFDNKLNLKFRLGLPPLGLFGINMRVLGTSDNPLIKYGKGSNDEELPETEYSNKLPDEMLQKIKNAREEQGNEELNSEKL